MKPSDACRQKRPRTFCSQYDKNTYNRAIQRGCELAFQMPVELRYVGRYVGRRQDLSENERKKLRRRLCAEAAEWRKKHCWRPNQLRHSAATKIRQEFGLEAAQVVLGHSQANVTEIYAERDYSLAAKVAKNLG